MPVAVAVAVAVATDVHAALCMPVQPKTMKKIEKLVEWYTKSKGVRADFLSREVVAAAGGDVVVDTFWAQCDDDTRCVAGVPHVCACALCYVSPLASRACRASIIENAARDASVLAVAMAFGIQEPAPSPMNLDQKKRSGPSERLKKFSKWFSSDVRGEVNCV